MSGTFTGSLVEQAAPAWLGSAGWQVHDGAEIAPGEPATERDDYGQMVRAHRLREALLQQLISGELRVKDAERAIQEATA